MSKIIEYLRKEAGITPATAVTAARAAGEATSTGANIIPYLIGISLAGGSAVGYLTSKMSSPSDSDREALQQRVMDTEVREEVGMQQRKLQALKDKLKERAQQNQKGISRKRDMFV